MSGLVWTIGMLGLVLNRGNVIGIVISLEVMVLGGLWAYGEGTIAVGSLIGELWMIGIITVAASETALGLGLIVGYYRLRGHIGVRTMNLLRG